MRKKFYVSPILEELLLEEVLWASGEEAENDFDDPEWGNSDGNGGDFDGEVDFEF